MTLLLPALAGVSSIFVGATLLYSRIRQIIPIKVNCWFCNEDSKVLLKNRNSFICRFCHQYNGFKEDGDYNCDIPAQHSEALNFSWSHPSKTSAQSKKSPGNGFCQICNLNQVLKTRALSEFSPLDESNYDGELEEFRKRLEEIYGLCRECEAVLHQTLGKQNSWLKPKLISWRLENSKKLLIKGVSYISREPLPIKMSYFLLFLISLLMSFCFIDKLKIIPTEFIVNSDLPLVPTYYPLLQEHLLLTQNAGVFIMLLMTVFRRENLKNSDFCCCFSWVFLLIFASFKTLLDENILYLIQFVCSAIAALTTIWAAFSSPPLKSSISKTKISPRMHEDESYCLDSTSTTTYEERRASENSDFISHTLMDGFHNNTTKDISPQTSKIENEGENNDLGATLDSLKISTPKKRSLPENFNPQSLFTEKDKGSCKPFREDILTPSRLGNKSVTQSSWVAGGYWGNTGSPRRLTQNNFSHLDEIKRPLFSLSRSSSQSSGFISHLSGKTSSDGRNPFQSFPNSCQSSLCGDKDNMDKASLFSEPVFNYWNASPSEGAASLPSLKPQRFPSHDAQSACSTYSQFSSASRHTPNASATTMYFNPSSRTMVPSNLEETRESTPNRDQSLLKYCNPWMAFILGLSISANVFLFLMLFKMDALVAIKL